MQPLFGSAGRPADHWPERIAPESDQDCRMDASNRKASPVGSSAAQPAHDVSDADGETITGDGSHKGEERPQEAAKPKAPPPAAMNCATTMVSGYNYEQATSFFSPHPNSAPSACGQSRVERPANDWQLQVDPAVLGELLEQRYHTPGRPKSV